MLKSSLIEILRTFTKPELIKFEDFVRSPYFNKKENVTKLFLEIKKYAPAFDAENLSKEKVWKVLLPVKEYNYGIMKNLIFDLNKLAEQFMINMKFCKDLNRQNEYLMSALIDREMNNIYKNKFRSISLEPDLNILNDNSLNITHHMDHLNSLYYIKFFYHHQYEQNYNLLKLQVDRDSSLIASFLIKLFGAYNDAVAISAFPKSDLQENIIIKMLDLISPGLDNLIKSIPQSSHVNSVIVMIYYKMYLSLKEKSEKQYLEFKKSVLDNLDILPKVNIKAIHNCLANAAMNTGFETLDRNMEIQQIIDSMADNNVLAESGNDRIPVHIFSTYVSICFLFGDSKKLKLFADRFIDKLDPEVKHSTGIHINFMLSYLNKSYHDALNYISMFDITYVFLKPSIRYKKAKCLYEIDDYELFLNEYDSLKHFMSNSKLLTETNKHALKVNFSFIKRLFNLRQNYNEYESVKLKNDISDWKHPSAKWAAEKLAEIEKTNQRLN